MTHKLITFLYLVILCLFMVGCGGTSPSGPVIPPTLLPSSRMCPVLPTQIRIPATGCDVLAVRLDNVLLTCGGDGLLHYELSTTTGGATRVAVTIANGSVLTTSGTPFDALCIDRPTVQIGITLGIEYTGEIGTEPTGPAPRPECIRTSKAVFTQFVTSDPLLSHPGIQQIFKDKIHEKLDDEVIALLWRTVGAPPIPSRCTNWRLLP